MPSRKLLKNLRSTLRKKGRRYVSYLKLNLLLFVSQCWFCFSNFSFLQVVSAGGLHVVGTERHESRRIDNQVQVFEKISCTVFILTRILSSLFFLFHPFSLPLHKPDMRKLLHCMPKNWAPNLYYAVAWSKWQARRSWKFTLLLKSWRQSLSCIWWRSNSGWEFVVIYILWC